MGLGTAFVNENYLIAIERNFNVTSSVKHFREKVLKVNIMCQIDPRMQRQNSPKSKQTSKAQDMM